MSDFDQQLHDYMSDLIRKGWANKRAARKRRHIKWLWDSFHHHANLFENRLNDPHFSEDLVRRSYADASEFLAQLREAEPLTRLIHWPEYEESR